MGPPSPRGSQSTGIVTPVGFVDLELMVTPFINHDASAERFAMTKKPSRKPKKVVLGKYRVSKYAESFAYLAFDKSWVGKMVKIMAEVLDD